MKLLLANKASIEASNADGEAPLHSAAAYNRVDVVRFLLQAGASVDASDKKWSTPAHSAASLGRTEVLKLLLKGGAKVDSLDGNLETPLFRAVHSICADQADTDSVVALLLDHGANPNAKSTDGWTPLFWAVQRNNLLVAKLLLQKGADSAIADQDGKTPLSLAVEKKNRKMIELLLGPKDAADTATKPSSSAPTDPHSRQ